ncbi:S-adenosyl-L-methionine-dependent methyltransferase [Bisporella sp. PMI_857]|nr:S-adenosyl-L-methionine-dependent methyltransferase [Bisporella sp. PMI_857]
MESDEVQADLVSSLDPDFLPANPLPLSAHRRSQESQSDQKQTDPFQFGSRFLSEYDNVFEFNAWDHVETDDTYKEYAELQYAKQREAPVSDFDKHRFNSDPVKWWNNFYKNNTANFFKDRKWLQQEFPILTQITSASAPPTTVLEVGAGAGNTAFPILKQNQNKFFKIHACDFSKRAVEVIRENEAYDHGQHIQADVWDVAGQALPPGLAEGTVDVVLMIFIFSALSPSQWRQSVSNIYKVLKPGGEVLFRDYGRGDLAQVRFKKGRYLDENFYIRGDGTRVYFFEKDELVKIWAGTGAGSPGDEQVIGTGFRVIDLGVDRRLLVNRAKQLKMYRCWMQGRFRKPAEN